MVNRPSLIHSSNVSRNTASPRLMARVCSHSAMKAGPRALLVRITAASAASSSRMPAEGAQPAKSSAAARIRWPSRPSMASVKALSSHGPS